MFRKQTRGGATVVIVIAGNFRSITASRAANFSEKTTT